MVPKKMQAMKGKQKQAPASSSSDEPSHGDKWFYFIDEDAVKTHKERFANREVLIVMKVVFHHPSDLTGLFHDQMLIPFLTTITDNSYNPHLVSHFYANLGISEFVCKSHVLGISIPFDETLLGHVLNIPCTDLDITLTFEELGWSYQEVNKAISKNKRASFKPNKINQLAKQARIIAYIVAANLIQKKGHFDELSELSCKAVCAITKKILVNWS